MVKRYNDTRQLHASSSEHAVYKFKKTIDNLDCSLQQKVLVCESFERGYELGFRTATEYYEDWKNEYISQLASMSPEQLEHLKMFSAALSRFFTDYEESEKKE